MTIRRGDYATTFDPRTADYQCRDCDTKLTILNWAESRRASHTRLCRSCDSKQRARQRAAKKARELAERAARETQQAGHVIVQNLTNASEVGKG